MPSTGPRNPLTRINIPAISFINHQGQMSIPKTPVIVPPILKLIFFGKRFEKAFEGAMTFAAILVLNVAIIIKTWAIITTHGLSNFPNKAVGSHGASDAMRTSLKINTDAQVTKIATKEYSIIVPGKPINCPCFCAFWDGA